MVVLGISQTIPTIFMRFFQSSISLFVEERHLETG